MSMSEAQRGASSGGQSDSLPVGTLLTWVGVALAGVYLVFFGGASNFLPSPQARILTQLVVLGASLSWLIAAARARVVVASPLLLPGAAYVVVFVCSTILSQRPAASREALALLLLAVPGYLVVRSIAWHGVLSRRVQWLFVMATAALVVAYLGQVLVAWIGWWQALGPSLPPLRPGDLSLTLGTANAVAAYLELMAAPAAWMAWRRWHRRWPAVLLAASALLALVITGSRGGWMGAAAGLGVLAVLRIRDIEAMRVRRVLAANRVAVVIAAAAVILLGAIAAPALFVRLDAGDAGRVELWRAAWAIFTGHPVLGAGPGAWQGLRPLSSISDPNTAVLYTCHDSVLQILAETGVLGLVAVTWLALAIARAGAREIRRSTGERRVEAEIAVAALVAIGVHSLVDTLFFVPAIALLTMFLVAQLDPPPGADAAGQRAVAGEALAKSLRQGRLTGRAALVPIAAAVLVGVVLLVPIDVAMVEAQLGNIALDQGRWSDAVIQFDRAVGLHPLPEYELGQAIAESRLGRPADALASLEYVDAREPFTFARAQVALLQLAIGDRSSAANSARQVAAAGPYDPTATLNAALVEDRLGNTAAASTMLSDVLDAVPSLVLTAPPPGTFADAMWREASAVALNTMAATDPLGAAGFALRMGATSLADSYAARAPDGPARQMYALLRAAVLGGAPELATGKRLIREAPDSSTALAWFAFLARQARSQAEFDAVNTVSIAIDADVPSPDYAVVANGTPEASLSLRLRNYPMAAASRLGPARPYIAGALTIEPSVGY
jgi:putative inorganic carbon (HCO3(-)) transporter